MPLVKSTPGCVRLGCGPERGSTGSPAEELRNVRGWDALKTVAEDPDRYLATAAEMLMAEGMTDAAEILRTSTAKVEKPSAIATIQTLRFPGWKTGIYCRHCFMRRRIHQKDS